MGDYSGIQTAPKQKKSLGLERTATKQGKNLVLALESTQQYSRQKYMPLRHMQVRI
jgi:hypothetical protein